MTIDPTSIVEREAIRAILLTPDNEVLLLRIRLPEVAECFWIAPGGGLEPGETVEEGLRRELREELGLVECVIVRWCGVDSTRSTGWVDLPARGVLHHSRESL